MLSVCIDVRKFNLDDEEPEFMNAVDLEISSPITKEIEKRAYTKVV